MGGSVPLDGRCADTDKLNVLQVSHFSQRLCCALAVNSARSSLLSD
jgi:hypothetical protein